MEPVSTQPSVTPTPPPAPQAQPPVSSVPPNKPTNKLLIILFVLILICSGGYFLYNSLNKQTTPVVQETITVTPQPFYLTIDSPKDNVTLVNGELLIAGKTLPKTVVIVYTDTDETSLESDSEGNFETTIIVGEAGGLVRVTAYAESGEEMTKTFNTSENGEVDVLGKSDKKVDNGKNEEKVAVAKEDKKSLENKMVKVELTRETKQEKIREFLQDDIAQKKLEKIGTRNIKNILSSESTESALLDPKLKLKKLAVLESSSEAPMKRHAVSGVITSVAEGVIIVSHQIQRDRTYAVYYNASTIIANKNSESSASAGLAVGMRVAAVGESLDDGILAKRIHVIPGKATGVFEKQPVATDEGDNVLTPSPEASGSPTLTPAVTDAITPTPTEVITPTPTI